MQNKRSLENNRPITLSSAAQERAQDLFSRLTRLILPTSAYDIPIWLKYHLGHYIDKLIKDLTNVVQNHTEIDQIKHSLHQLCDYLNRQRYHLQIKKIDANSFDSCNMKNIIHDAISRLPSTQRRIIKYSYSKSFRFKAPQAVFQDLLTSLIETYQQACVSTDTGYVELWIDQGTQHNQLHLKCSAAIDFHKNEEEHALDFNVQSFYCQHHLWKQLFAHINGAIETHPNSEQQGVYVILSFPHETAVDDKLSSGNLG